MHPVNLGSAVPSEAFDLNRYDNPSDWQPHGLLFETFCPSIMRDFQRQYNEYMASMHEKKVAQGKM